MFVKQYLQFLMGVPLEKYCGHAANCTSLQGVSTHVPLPHMRTSCPHDKMGLGVPVSTLVEHKVTGVIMW